jgi:hypothetical protein
MLHCGYTKDNIVRYSIQALGWSFLLKLMIWNIANHGALWGSTTSNTELFRKETMGWLFLLKAS